MKSAVTSGVTYERFLITYCGRAQLGGRRTFEQVPRDSCAERFDRQIRILVHREDDHFRRGKQMLELTRGSGSQAALEAERREGMAAHDPVLFHIPADR